ncbi:amidohydrolase family protein [Streptomyces sp. NPDC050085]|uniref:amidohydrolase family protein n=1 Tax=Streptomyces sp. NPDC050085 TaxID=3365600 RepID=UPI0037B7E236
MAHTAVTDVYTRAGPGKTGCTRSGRTGSSRGDRCAAAPVRPTAPPPPRPPRHGLGRRRVRPRPLAAAGPHPGPAAAPLRRPGRHGRDGRILVRDATHRRARPIREDRHAARRRIRRRGQRAGRAWRCRDLWDAGARVVLGSDWPIAAYPPLGVLAGARYRRPSRDLSLPPHGPEQALTGLEALRAMTLNPAYASGEERESGALAVGFRGDLSVFAADPVGTPAVELPDVPVRLTAVGGRVTFRSAEV